jgi:hypothetical protein
MGEAQSPRRDQVDSILRCIGKWAEAVKLRHMGIASLLASSMCACSIAFSGQAAATNVLLSDLRPRCIGRFVFDRPAPSEIVSQRYEFAGEKLETEYNVSLATYEARVEARERELRGKRRMNLSDGSSDRSHSWLEKAFSPVKNSRVLIYLKADTRVSLPFKSDSYIYDNEVLFHMVGGVGPSAMDRAEAIYGEIVRRIKQRDNWAVPTQSGFCFAGGIVMGASTYTEEISQSFALMPGRPAMLVIQMRDSRGSDQKETLTRTLPELRAQLDRLPGRYRILRQGKRTVADMNAEEVLFELKEGDITSYQFYLIAPGDPSTLAKSHTAIQLLLGASRPDLTPDQATSPVDEGEALQVWESILNSLRLRPGAV